MEAGEISGPCALVTKVDEIPGPVRVGETGYVRELAGPYLVSGGWWRSVVHREYYFARMHDGEMLWIYYDRRRRRWRWQGQVE